jgi:hypothetical protein
MTIYGESRLALYLDKFPEDKLTCKRLDWNRIHLSDVTEQIPSLRTFRNVMTLKSQPGDFSVASHGNVKVKEGETVDMLIDPHRESRAHQ